MALAGGDLNKPMVVFCVNSERFAGYNLVLRLAALGYTYVHSTVRGPEEGTWAPGYYSVLFEDPDGIRLEMCFVPGAGVLEAGVSFDPKEGYVGT